MIAVTFALPSESSAFLRRLQNRVPGAAGSHTVAGTLHGSAICVLHTGVGGETTRTRIKTFLPDQTPQLLISSGFAGALTDQWRVGELLWAENFSTAKSDPIYRKGRLETATVMVDALAERQKLADEGADAVDMETQFIADACRAANIPLISLRVISDTPANPFPAPPHILFDIERQRTPFATLLTYLLRQPAALGRFVGFARQIARARQSLALALDSVIRDTPKN